MFFIFDIVGLFRGLGSLILLAIVAGFAGLAMKHMNVLLFWIGQ